MADRVTVIPDATEIRAWGNSIDRLLAPSVSFAIEPLSALETPEAAALFDAHWREIGQERDLLELDPDWDLFRKAEASGQLLIVTARDNAGALVGYVLAFVRRHPHYRPICGFEDSHFLRADMRGQGNGKAMLKFASDAMRDRGARVAFIHGKLEHDHRSMLEEIGFRPLDFIYVKRL